MIAALRSRWLKETHKRIGIAIVLRGSDVLVGVRGPGTVLEGMHEFPGGKCEPGETPAACAIRECFEETGLRVDVTETIQTTRFSYPHGDVELSFFLCRLLDDHQDREPQGNFRWIPVRELSRCQFPEGNRDALARLWERFATSGQLA